MAYDATCPATPIDVDAHGVKIIRGPAGDSPRIGENGNWWVGDEDTGTKASVKEHGELNGLGQPDQHPIDAITGLREVIDALPTAMTADELRKILIGGGNKNA